MKTLREYIKEEFETAEDVIGMGNPMAPSLENTPGELSSEAGSGDIPNEKRRVKKKRKKCSE